MLMDAWTQFLVAEILGLRGKEEGKVFTLFLQAVPNLGHFLHQPVSFEVPNLFGPTKSNQQ